MVMEAMQPMPCMWSDQESREELKHKLLCLNFQLESAKLQAEAKKSKEKETIKHLLRLLKKAYRERDEARDQLQKLLTSIVLSHVQPPRSHSPLNCSPDLSNTNIVDSSNSGLLKQPSVQNCSGSIQGIVSSGNAVLDRASVTIDTLVKGKALPQKGRLLDTVIEAGPLLETLLIAGSLPQWRNPPPLDPRQIPSYPIKKRYRGSAGQKTDAYLNCTIQSTPISSNAESSNGSSQISSSSIMNFALGCGSSVNGDQSLSDGINSGFIHHHISTGKQRKPSV